VSAPPELLDVTLGLARRALRVAHVSFVAGSDAAGGLAAIARHAFANADDGAMARAVGSVLTVPVRAADGRSLGALVASDARKRDFDDVEVAMLRDFARLAAQYVVTPTTVVPSPDEEALRRLSTIANGLPAMIGYWTRDLRCEFANDAYRAWFGIPPERIVGITMNELLGPALFAENEPFVRRALRGVPQRFQRRLIKADGTATMTDAQYLPDKDAQGNVRGLLVMANDVERLFAAQQTLEETNVKMEATTDFLTGLNNRRVFERRSAEAFARFDATGVAFGLILLDLDGFKGINDTYGHDTGDDVLRIIGRLLAQNVRGDDVAARVGGEEFAILSFGARSAPDLCALAERVRSAVGKERIETSLGSIAMTCSLGVALTDDGDDDFRTVYARADAALYEVKRRGKNAVGFKEIAA